MQAFGVEATNAEVGLWLTKVLRRDNDAQGDSAKIAGMLDFLRTQGRWAASVRLAYQRAVANSMEEASGRGPLKVNALAFTVFFYPSDRRSSRRYTDFLKTREKRHRRICSKQAVSLQNTQKMP